MKTIASSIGVIFVWLLYIIAIRPAFLLVEIIDSLVSFFVDIVKFPVDFIRKNDEMEAKAKSAKKEEEE